MIARVVVGIITVGASELTLSVGGVTQALSDPAGGMDLMDVENIPSMPQPLPEGCDSSVINDC